MVTLPYSFSLESSVLFSSDPAGKRRWCILTFCPEFDVAAWTRNSLPSDEYLTSGTEFESLEIVTAPNAFMG